MSEHILGGFICQRYRIDKHRGAGPHYLEFEGVDKISDCLVTVKITPSKYNATPFETQSRQRTAVDGDLRAEHQVYVNSGHFGPGEYYNRQE